MFHFHLKLNNLYGNFVMNVSLTRLILKQRGISVPCVRVFYETDIENTWHICSLTAFMQEPAGDSLSY